MYPNIEFMPDIVERSPKQTAGKLAKALNKSQT